MKNAFILALLLASNAFVLHAQTAQSGVAKIAPQEVKLLGKCTLNDFRQEPFAQWFDKNASDYKPSNDVIERLKKTDINQLSIKIFLGTWCGDSKREFPRFVSILRQLGFPEANVEIIAVDNVDSAYKQSPTHEERGYEIYRVPTFVVSQKGKEIGRIVEYPTTSLERDLLTIARREAYRANYATFPFVYQWLKDGLLADSNVSDNARGLAAALRTTVSTESELNSCGYVLLSRGQMQEAITVFRINTLLFPQSSNCFDSLAEAYTKVGNKTLAGKWYGKALELDAKNTSIVEKIIKLKTHP